MLPTSFEHSPGVIRVINDFKDDVSNWYKQGGIGGRNLAILL